MITEERRSVLEIESRNNYIELCRNSVWPSLRASGGKVICMLTGMIGRPSTHLLQMTSYADLESWQTAQGAWSVNRESLISQESVRLLRPIASRPKDTVPPEDRRSVYGYRKFFISPTDISQIVTCSEEGIWPRIENMGACVLGMWTPMASVSPCLLYTSPSPRDRG